MSLVSVIIPTHNRNHMLLRAISSVLSQTYSPCEIIVVDDVGNADMILQEFGNRVQYIRIPQTPYPAESRNVGVKNARGKYIAFLDDDDLWLPDKIQTQVDIFISHPEIALICTDAYVQRGIKMENSGIRYLNDSVEKAGFLLEALLADNFIITSTCIVRQDVLLDVGGFSENPLFRGIEDYELWLRISVRYPIHYTPIPFIIYQDACDSLRSKISLIRYYDGLSMMYAELKSQIPVNTRYQPALRCLAQKAKENEIAKLCILFTGKEWIQFRALFKALITTYPMMIPRILLCLFRASLRQVTKHRFILS